MHPHSPQASEGLLTPLGVFAHAAFTQQIVIVLLILSIPAALAVLALKLSRETRLSGGSAFLSSMRIGAPILGLLGGSYSGLAMAMGVVNLGVEPTLRVLAPGIAETFMVVGLGFLAGAVAVIANWAVEARIDRRVLGV